MRQSQLEIKSIEAELRSIRADTKSSAQSVSLLEAGVPPDESALRRLGRDEFSQPQSASIAPTIARQATVSPRPVAPSAQPRQQRRVECFPISSPQSTQTQADAASQVELATVIEQLRHYSSSGRQQPSPSARRSANRQTTPPQKVNAMRQLLEEKAKQINHLSTQQEMAILELMQISGQLNQKWQETDADSKLKNELTLECEAAEIPYIERDRNGILILTNRSIEPVRTPNERTLTKATKNPRQHHRNSRNGTHWMGRIWRWIGTPAVWAGAASVNVIGRTGLGQPHTPRRKGYRGSGRQAATSTADLPVTLRETATLVVGSALLRLSLDWVVMSYPVLWIPTVLVMITPAAFAIYRSTVKPPTGFAWGYRLFAILIGLLLGGRL